MNAVYDRPFQLWACTVGHGHLLLRSPKSESLSTRVDVVFAGAIAAGARRRREVGLGSVVVVRSR